MISYEFLRSLCFVSILCEDSQEIAGCLQEKHEEHLRALSNICHTKKGSEAAVAEVSARDTAFPLRFRRHSAKD